MSLITEELLRKKIKNILLQEKLGGSLADADEIVDVISTAASEAEASGVALPVDDKRLDAVDKDFRPIVERIMGLLKGQGFDPMIGSAYRSPKSQQEKIAKGYSKTKTVYGYHVALDAQGNKAARAVDLVNRGDGWSNTKAAFDFFEALGKIANSAEFKDKVQWGGNWTPKKKTIEGKEYFIGWDPAHIQTRAMSMSQSKEITMKGIAALKAQGKDMESIAEAKDRQHIIKVSEEDLRKLINEMLVQEGLGDSLVGAFKSAKDWVTDKVKSFTGSVDVKDPVTIKGGNYPAQNVRHVEAAMTAKGITNKYVRVGILCTIAKESNFKPKNEKTYQNTSLSRIYTIWPKLKKLGDAKVEAMKKSTSPSDGHKQAGLGFFDYLYGGKNGNGPEKTGDGSRYRGRGFNQVTFKGTYEKYGKLAGIDLVGNPDQLNKPDIAAKVAVAFLANRLKEHYGSINPPAKSYEEGIKMAATANCGSKSGVKTAENPGGKKDCSRAVASATERLTHFKYDGDGGENLAKNDKNKNDDSKNT